MRTMAHLATTPGQLRLLSIATVVGVVLLSVIAAGASGARNRAAGAVSVETEPLLVNAQGMYASLADADATAADTFLTGGIEPTDLRQRYLNDLKTATDQLSTATRQVGGSTAAQQAVTTISDQLPIYSGLIETARADNRQSLPVGAAYLRQASTLMRSQILPAADRLYEVEAARLDHGYQSGSSALDVVGVLVAGAALLALLALTQLYLARRTNRMVNVPLLVASVLGLVLTIGLVTGFMLEQRHLHRAQVEGSDAVQVLSQARILTLRAQGDEGLTLVARGSGDPYQADFKAVTARIGGPDGSSGLLGRMAQIEGAPVSSWSEYRQYLAVHQQVVQLEQSGQFDQAVKVALGRNPGGESSQFDALNTDLTNEITSGQARFSSQARSAHRELRNAGVIIAVVLLAVGLLALFGIQQRINEYR
jgi:hypothetical protein